MNIGELKHRITIQQCTKASDGQGGFTSTWSTLVSVWSKATPQSERERFYRGENQHTQGYTLQSDKTKQSQYPPHAIAIIYALSIVTSITALQVLADAMMI